jgi:hypothetical protein
MSLTTHPHATALTALCDPPLGPALVIGDTSTKPIKERGLIKSVDLTAQTLVVTEGKNPADRTLQWTAQTKFRERDDTTSPSDLKPDERVRLSYTAGGSTPTLWIVHIASAKTEEPTAKNISHTASKGE